MLTGRLGYKAYSHSDSISVYIIGMTKTKSNKKIDRYSFTNNLLTFIILINGQDFKIYSFAAGGSRAMKKATLIDLKIKV